MPESNVEEVYPAIVNIFIYIILMFLYVLV